MNCGIEVNSKPGTTYPNSGLPNGPGTLTRPDSGQQVFGLGFTVSGWVSGGIGKIGGDSIADKDRVNPQNPNGTWTLDQESNRWTGEKGYKPTWSDITPNMLAINAKDSTFTYYGQPRTNAGTVPGLVRD